MTVQNNSIGYQGGSLPIFVDNLIDFKRTGWRFYFIKDVEKQKFIKLEGWNKIRLALKDNKEKFEEIRKNQELQNIIADALVRNKTDEKIKEYLNEKGIDEIILNAVLKLIYDR